MNQKMRLVALVAGLALVGALAFRWQTRKPEDSATVRYSAARVESGDIVRAVLTTGQLMPLVSIEVSTQISGQITEVSVDFNTPVKKGQILAKIDPSTYLQKLNQAKADLAAAEASAALAKLKAERQKTLLAQSMVTQQEFDEAAAQLQQTEANLLTRKAAVENAQVDLDRCTLTAPIDGIVIYKSAEVGKTVQASFSAPTLFVIAEDLRRMQIIASISEVDIWSVKPGQEVSFSVEALPERKFKGVLKQIRNPYTPSDQKNNATPSGPTIASFDAVIEVENKDLLLLPSLSANVSIIIDRREDALRVPNSALRVQIPGAPPLPVEKNEAVVFRLAEGDRTSPPDPVVVRLGLSDSIQTEVISGLNAGDTIVTGIVRAPEQWKRSIF